MAVIECTLPEIQARVQAARRTMLVVHHFATWCGPCAEEMPRVVELASHIPVLAISWDLFMASNEDGMGTVQEFARETGIDFDVLVYRGLPQLLIDAFEVTEGTVPYTMVYNEAGTVIYRWDGLLEPEQLAHIRSLAVHA